MTDPARLASDVERVRTLAAASRGRIGILALPTAASPVLGFELLFATVASENYPRQRSQRTRISVSLPARYPFQPPVATVQTAIFHPNVFESGIVCLGTRWLPSEGLDLFVQRLARLVAFDPLLVNTASPANRAAAAWYESALRAHPQLFPTVALEDLAAPAQARRKVGWTEVAADDDRVTRSCPSCGRVLRLPRGRTGKVKCPACAVSFEART